VAHLKSAIPDPDAWTAFVIRLEGARFGSRLGGETMGGSLKAASGGADLFQYLFNKMPQGRMRDLLVEIAGNPELMATLLEKPSSHKQAFKISMQIHGYMFQAGLSPFMEDNGGNH